MPRGLHEVLDQYLEPLRLAPAGGLETRRILVPALPGDATVARLTLALAQRLRASTVSCAVRGLDVRSRALCHEGVTPPRVAPELALCLATERADSDAATLLFLLPGWELRAELLRGAALGSEAPLWVLAGEVGGGDAGARWRLARFGLVPAAVDALAGPLATALHPAAARPDTGLEALARRLGAFARQVAVPRLDTSPVVFPLPRNSPE